MDSDLDVPAERLCQNCGVKPVYQTFNYCSKTCGSEAARAAPPRRAATLPTQRIVMCDRCGARPRNRGHEYCSRACGQAAQRGPPARRSSLWNSAPQGPNHTRRARGPPASAYIGDDSDDDGYDQPPPQSRGGDRSYRIITDFDDIASPSARQRPPHRTSDATDPGYYDSDEDSQQGGGGGRLPEFPPRDESTCINCRRNPKVPNFDFCSKFCRGQAMDKLESLNGAFRRTSFAPRPRAQPRGKPCAIGGCNGLEFKPGAKYCGHECRKKAVTQGLEVACLLCKKLPKVPGKHFCSKTCGQAAEAGAPMLLDLPKTDPKYADIANQFNTSWTGTAPAIHRICKVVNSKATESNFQKHRNTVEAAGKFASRRTRTSPGDERRRWHGTIRACTIGDTATNLTPCVLPGCSLCAIIRTSFDTTKSRCQANGLYCSAFSSTSHGYTRAGTPGSPYRAMFLTRVIVGKNHVGGYMPVAGTDSTAIDTKHTELIVFRNDAICPSWLILYG